MKIQQLIRGLTKPDPVGVVDFKPKKIELPQKFQLLRLIISLICIAIIQYFILSSGKGGLTILFYELLMISYLALSYFLTVKPNYKHAGKFPFFINLPFKISDNYNRLLIGLTIIFKPGEFISHGIMDILK
ncbi:MAG: hypothetical protein IPL23_27265 [Saprospiraceae bacterium]|nr:hypothetical protein [Saprospiraceae bacterium]